ncbi:MAG: hypothetical protein KA401_04925 [Anaerolineae bacterium]|nr:hypothetical protein [Anaerolineae bacterium]
MFTRHDEILVLLAALFLLITPMLDPALMFVVSLVALVACLYWSSVIFPHSHA